MFVSRWWRQWTKGWAVLAGRAATSATRRRSVRLFLERLEQRLTPSSFVYQVTSTADNEVNAITDGHAGTTADPYLAPSLRSAVEAANDDGGTDTIEFAPSLTAGGPTVITLMVSSLPTLEISGQLTIQGPGANRLTIDGGNQYQDFLINAGANVTLDGLTIAHGSTNFTQGNGGGLLNNGTLNVSNCTFAGNSTQGIHSNGGGLANAGSAIISNCTFSGNSVTGDGSIGGGVYNAASSTMTVVNCTFAGNSATGTSGGGGGLGNDGDLVVSSSTFSGNSASGKYDNGGAIDTAHLMTLTTSTVLGNSTGTGGVGGGIFNSTTLSISDCTIADNSAGPQSADGIGGQGGGIDNESDLVVTSSTISGNAAGTNGSGGGIYLQYPALLQSVIVAGNVNSSGSPDDISGSSLSNPSYSASSAYNLIGDAATAGGLTDGDANHNIVGHDPLLGTLAGYGGPTETFPLGSSSPARAAGTAVLTTLASPIVDTSSTSITVTNAFPGNTASIIPLDGVIQIGSEQMTVTAIAGNTLTVTRGANGTTAATHNSGANISLALDQRGESRLLNGNADIGAFQSQSTATQGSISGEVFNDTNGNGILDEGEQPLSGFTVYLDLNNDENPGPTVHATPSSDVPHDIAAGNTSRSVLRLDGVNGNVTAVKVTLDLAAESDPNVRVSLIGPDGTRVPLFSGLGSSAYRNTTLDDLAETDIRDGAAPYSGSYRPLGSLAQFNGLDPNGEWQLEVQSDTDPAFGTVGTLNSWSLSVTTQDPIITTAADGRFSFNNLNWGQYHLVELAKTEFRQTSVSSQEILLSSNTAISNFDFGAQLDLPSSISGTVFNDLNGDGIRQAGEPGLANQTVFMDYNGNGVPGEAGVTLIVPDEFPFGSGNVLVPTNNNAPAYQSLWMPSGIAGFADSGFLTADMTLHDPAQLKLALITPSGRHIPLNPGILQFATNPSEAPEYQLTALWTLPGSEDGSGTWQLQFSDGPHVGNDALRHIEVDVAFSEPSVQTDSQGSYSFGSLDGGGLYPIQAEAPAGWQQTGGGKVQTYSPASSATFDLGLHLANPLGTAYRANLDTGVIHSDIDGDYYNTGSAPVNLTVEVGTPVTLTAKFTGANDPGGGYAFPKQQGTLGVQWQASTDGGKSFTDIAGATAATFSFAATASGNGNIYQAVFSGVKAYAQREAFSVNTNTATVAVYTPPTVSANPADQSVIIGNPVTFTAAATGFPVPSVQWQVSSDGGASFSDLPGFANSTTLTIFPAVSQTGYQYRAVFSNAAGTATTRAAVLTVNKAATDTELAFTANPVLFGQVVNVVARVSPVGSTEVPSGTLQFRIDGANDGSPVPLDSGTASISPALAVGTHPTAGYFHSTSADFTDSDNSIRGLGLTVKAVSSSNLQDAIVAALRSGTPIVFQAGPSQTDAIVNAVDGLKDPGSPVTLTVNLAAGTYMGISASPPKNVTLVIKGTAGSTTFVGHSPALTVLSGTVVVKDVTLTNATNAPTILVKGGTLMLRQDTIQESTAANQSDIVISGGSVDLGSQTNPGGNILNINGAGTLISNSTPSQVNLSGNTLEVDGIVPRFDFNADSNPANTAPSYLGVPPTSLYSAARGFGWQTTPTAGFDRGGSDLLLRDGHEDRKDRTFLVDLPRAGAYQVMLTLGDASNARDQMQVFAQGEATPKFTLSTRAGEFATETFIETLSGARPQLRLRFHDNGGSDPYWVVNALDVRPAQNNITITRTSPVGNGPLAADGLTVDTFQGMVTGLPSNASVLINLTTTLGALTSTDQSTLYQGSQVLVSTDGQGNGAFSFTVQRPSGPGTATIVASEVSGLAFGTSTQVYQLPMSRHLDFNADSNSANTAPGYLGMPPTSLYSTAAGLGWQTTPADGFDRGGTNLLLRDGNYGRNDRTFLVDLPAAGAYQVTLTLGDANYARDRMQVFAQGETKPRFTASTRAGEFATETFVVNLSGTRPQLKLRFHDNGGSDPYWVVNALDVRPT